MRLLGWIIQASTVETSWSQLFCTNKCVNYPTDTFTTDDSLTLCWTLLIGQKVWSPWRQILCPSLCPPGSGSNSTYT